MTLMAAVVGLSLGLLSELRPDLSYAMQPDRAEHLGLATEVEHARLESNRYVRVQGTPMLSAMVRFERGFFGREQVVFPLAGQRDIFVQVDADALRDPRTAARTEFAGRLVSFGELGARFRIVREYMAKQMDMPVTGQTYLLVADDPPKTHAWAFFFAAFCAASIALSLWLFSRWFRPLRPS